MHGTWPWVVALSALALATVVVADLRRTVDEQAAQARGQARRDAEREAAALAAALCTRAALDLVPAAARFTLVGENVSIPEDLGTLDPVAVDPFAGLDPLAAERLRRVASAPAFDSLLAEATPLFADPTLPAATRAWLRAHAAWRAHRDARPTERDALLADLLDHPAPAAPVAAASALLLAATRDAALPPAALALVPTLPAAHARAFCNRLAALGLDATPLRTAARTAAARRALLHRIAALAPSLAAAPAPLARADGDDLLLYQPAERAGALVDRAHTHTLCARLLDPAATSRLHTGASPPPDAPLAAIAVVRGLVALVPRAPPAPGLFAGSTGTALLLAALALLCGAGSLLALRAQRRAAASLRTRSEFLTLVTHELKTPLAGIRLVGDLLADGHVTDERERAAWLARLQAEAARLGLLIENVLDLGRLETRERAHAPALLDLGAFMSETLELAGPWLARDGFEVRVSLPASPLQVDADAGTLRQAVFNLLDNARKYGRSPIEVAVRVTDGRACIAVRDHGDGVPARERDAVFTRFHRGAAHRHGAIPGVGLGLHLARAIAERHGGGLAYRELDAGACFELWLPARGILSGLASAPSPRTRAAVERPEP